nr:FmdB family zinc ribbon protein [Austwickia chelonae]
MPTYAYACTDCGHNFEVRQSFSDNALTDCPECTGRLRKLFNAVGVVFKGSGFYRTDSRGSSSSSTAASSSSSSAPSTGSPSSGSSSDSSSSSSASSTSSASNSSSTNSSSSAN